MSRLSYDQKRELAARYLQEREPRSLNEEPGLGRIPEPGDRIWVLRDGVWYRARVRGKQNLGRKIVFLASGSWPGRSCLLSSSDRGKTWDWDEASEEVRERGGDAPAEKDPLPDSIPAAAYHYARLFDKLRAYFREMRDVLEEVGRASRTCEKTLAGAVVDASRLLRKVEGTGGASAGSSDLWTYRHDLLARTCDDVDRLAHYLHRVRVVGLLLADHVGEMEARLGKPFAVRLLRHCYREMVSGGSVDAGPLVRWWSEKDPDLAYLVTGENLDVAGLDEYAAQDIRAAKILLTSRYGRCGSSTAGEGGEAEGGRRVGGE